jgi:hypothetical protein
MHVPCIRTTFHVYKAGLPVFMSPRWLLSQVLNVNLSSHSSVVA